jgi:hypothetical protein
VNKFPRIPVSAWAAIAGLLGLAATATLWITHYISTSGRLTAYATTVLAIGTVGLAGGAIGTYVEQRKANQSQAQEIAEQKRQLERSRENEMAQVFVRRRSGPGQRIKVEVTNGATHAIRFVYVWVSVEGVPGNCQTVVIEEDPRSGQDVRSRKMQNTPRLLQGEEISQCYRALLPGDTETFVQYIVTNPQVLPDVGDAAITAHALFEAVDGAWWKCSEDGTVRKLDVEPPLMTAPDLSIEVGAASNAPR